MNKARLIDIGGITPTNMKNCITVCLLVFSKSKSIRVRLYCIHITLLTSLLKMGHYEAIIYSIVFYPVSRNTKKKSIEL
jgi:hypothetical protein